MCSVDQYFILPQFILIYIQIIPEKCSHTRVRERIISFGTESCHARQGILATKTSQVIFGHFTKINLEFIIIKTVQKKLIQVFRPKIISQHSILDKAVGGVKLTCLIYHMLLKNQNWKIIIHNKQNLRPRGLEDELASQIEHLYEKGNKNGQEMHTVLGKAMVESPP